MPSPIVSCHVVENEGLIYIVYAPLMASVSMEELTEESAADTTLSTVCKYILNGWSVKVPPDVQLHTQISCWNNTCLAWDTAIIPAKLRGQVLAMVHKGHFGIVKLKQHCRDLIWWPELDKDFEPLVRDCTPSCRLENWPLC